MMQRPFWPRSATRKPCTMSRIRRGFAPRARPSAAITATMEPAVDPEQIFLTTSTSEAYSFLFRLLCDPGDEVLIGQPGYPLFDFLATLDDVRLVPYELFYDHGWHLDLEALRRRVTSRTRAIVGRPPQQSHRPLHPPRGAGCDRRIVPRARPGADRGRGVSRLWARWDTGREELRHGDHPVPTFVLSGLSKVAALPQMKAAWIACFAEQRPCSAWR